MCHRSSIANAASGSANESVVSKFEMHFIIIIFEKEEYPQPLHQAIHTAIKSEMHTN